MKEALGLFVPGEGTLHRLHPLPKMLISLWGVVAPFVVPLAALPLLLAVATLGSMALVGRRARGTYLRRLVIFTLPATASIVLVNAFFLPGASDEVLRLGPFAATREGLGFGLPIAGRVAIAVAATLAFVMSTRPDDLMEALIGIGAPTSLAFVVLSTIQTVPRMQDKARRILDAQQARGLRTTGGWRSRSRALIPLIGPLVIGSLVDVRDRGLALEARGFGSGERRTAYRVLVMGTTDRLLVVLAVLALAALPGYLAARVLGIL